LSGYVGGWPPRRLCLLFVAVSLLLGSVSQAAPAKAGHVPLPFDKAAFRKDLDRIASLDRTTGGEGENQSIDYIAGQLAKSSVAWKIEPFRAYVSFPVSASLVVDGAGFGDALTYSFSGNTPAAGITGRLAVASVAAAPDGDPAGGIGLPADCHGLIVMVDSWPLPEVARKIEECGAAGAVFTSDSKGLINFIASPVWGTPSGRNVGTLPSMPGLTLRRSDFLALATRAANGSTYATLRAHATREWRTLRLLTATVEGRRPDYLLVGAHIDSWDFGATDNGVADAMLLSFARALRRGPPLERTVKFAWWPGHSQGRYAGSAWFADAHWADLAAYAVGYLNEDVLGSRDADRFTLVSSAEFERMAVGALAKDLPNLQPVQRPGRYADQSFFGIGLPSLSLVHGKAEGTSDWWHDSHDTLDRVSMSAVEAEYRAIGDLLLELASRPTLPVRFLPLADQIVSRLADLQKAAGDRFSLKIAALAAAEFRRQALVTDAALASGRLRPGDRSLLAVSQALNPVLYTSGDRFEPDEAISQAFIPSLSSAIRLQALDRDQAAFASVSLVRGQARLVDALNRATCFLKRLHWRRMSAERR